jgi:hypothetical protein
MRVGFARMGGADFLFVAELPCAGVIPKLFGLCRLQMAAQFLCESLCDLYFETVQSAQDRREE